MNEATDYLKHVVTRRHLLRAGCSGDRIARVAFDVGSRRPRCSGQKGRPHFAPKAKRIIFLFMNGAPLAAGLVRLQTAGR